MRGELCKIPASRCRKKKRKEKKTWNSLTDSFPEPFSPCLPFTVTRAHHMMSHSTVIVRYSDRVINTTNQSGEAPANVLFCCVANESSLGGSSCWRATGNNKTCRSEQTEARRMVSSARRIWFISAPNEGRSSLISTEQGDVREGPVLSTRWSSSKWETCDAHMLRVTLWLLD